MGRTTATALRATAAEFVRREVAPHLQEWEDAGEIPRELHRGGRAGRGCSASRFPEAVGGEGGDLLDTVALQEAMFEAGASSGLMAGAVHRRHRAAAPRRQRLARPRRPLRPPDAGRREDRLARGHRAGRRLRRRRHPHHARVARRRRTTSSTAPRPSSPAGSAPTSSPPRCAPAAAGPRRGRACWWSRRARPASPSTATLTKMGWHCSDTAELSFVDVRVPAANLVGEENSGFYQIAEQFVVERIALAVHAYGIAARSLALTAAYCRERETFGKPLVANQVVRHKLVEMHRQVEVARTYTREVAAPPRRRRERDRRGLPGQADRLRRRDVRLRPGRPAARRRRATCTGPRWSGTTATPGSCRSEEERPRC